MPGSNWPRRQRVARGAGWSLPVPRRPLEAPETASSQEQQVASMDGYDKETKVHCSRWQQQAHVPIHKRGPPLAWRTRLVFVLMLGAAVLSLLGASMLLQRRQQALTGTAATSAARAIAMGRPQRPQPDQHRLLLATHNRLMWYTPATNSTEVLHEGQVGAARPSSLP